MLVKTKKLLGLPVQTKNGHSLGRLIDLEIETDTSDVKKYIVGADNWLKHQLVPDLVIDSSQVIEITDQAIVVEDGLLKKPALSQST